MPSLSPLLLKVFILNTSYFVNGVLARFELQLVGASFCSWYFLSIDSVIGSIELRLLLIPSCTYELKISCCPPPGLTVPVFGRIPLCPDFNTGFLGSEFFWGLFALPAAYFPRYYSPSGKSISYLTRSYILFEGDAEFWIRPGFINAHLPTVGLLFAGL